METRINKRERVSSADLEKENVGTGIVAKRPRTNILTESNNNIATHSNANINSNANNARDSGENLGIKYVVERPRNNVLTECGMNIATHSNANTNSNANNSSNSEEKLLDKEWLPIVLVRRLDLSSILKNQETVSSEPSRYYTRSVKSSMEQKQMEKKSSIIFKNEKQLEDFNCKRKIEDTHICPMLKYKKIKFSSETLSRHCKEEVCYICKFEFPSFTHIYSNIGLVKGSDDCDDSDKCSCKPIGDTMCVNQCVNRAMSIECQPTHHKCSNQDIGQRKYAEVYVKFVENKGWGLFAKDKIKKGAFVIECLGEVVSNQEYLKRESHCSHNYWTDLGRFKIDSGNMGNESRFVNHSCEANCLYWKWAVNSEYRIGIFANVDIEPDTELTIDYNYGSNSEVFCPCNCGSKNCSTCIGKK